MDAIKSYFEIHGLKVILDFYIIFVLVVYGLRIFSVSSKIRKMIKHILVIILIGVVSYAFDLDISFKFFKYLIFWSPAILVVIFAPEIRQILVGYSPKQKENYEYNYAHVKSEILDAVEYLSVNKIGALITFERKQSLEEVIQKSTSIIEATVNAELICSIFLPGTPLHDGGLIISNDKIRCAGAYYPSTDRADVPKNLGSRHRAAIGLSEINDSLTIIVSEETGKVSIAIQGILDYGVHRDELEVFLDKYIDSRKWW